MICNFLFRVQRYLFTKNNRVISNENQSHEKSFDKLLNLAYFLKLLVCNYKCFISSIPWWTRNGITQRRMLISGSSYLAMAYKTSILVNKIEISPSIFILCFLITPSIPWSTSIPSKSARLVLLITRNIFYKSFK